MSLKLVGRTSDGRVVVTGVGKFYFEQGLPLVFCFDELRKENMIPSWIHLYMELKDNGMGHERVMHLLNEHVHDSYGKEMRDRVVTELEKYSAHLSLR